MAIPKWYRSEDWLFQNILANIPIETSYKNYDLVVFRIGINSINPYTL